MLILLPPSETKRAGGKGRPLQLDALALPGLRPQREAVIAALIALSADEERAVRVLKLGPALRGDVAVNARLREAPAMAAIDRYTGVLYDGLDAASLDAPARRWLGAHVLIHSAPFGPVSALDRIPAYRLGAATVLPGVVPLRRLWAEPVREALAAASPSFVLDLRSEAYAALGPAPHAAYVRVVTADAGGAVRALNHFNKHAKGMLVRTLAQARPRLSTRDGFVRWAEGAGIRIRPNAAGELELIA